MSQKEEEIKKKKKKMAVSGGGCINKGMTNKFKKCHFIALQAFIDCRAEHGNDKL